MPHLSPIFWTVLHFFVWTMFLGVVLFTEYFTIGIDR